MTWLIIGMILFFLLPPVFWYVTEAMANYQEAMLKLEMRRYFEYCQAKGLTVEDSFVEILASTRD
jgi:hypothetical protein